MRIGKLFAIEMMLIYAVLIAGAAVFAFPFAWMVATSFKINREMATQRLRMMPATPRPQLRSPYIDPDEFDPPERLDGVPQVVWDQALPRLQAQLGMLVDQWQPSGSAADEIRFEPTTYRREMIEGLFHVLSQRISDRTRAAVSLHTHRSTLDESALESSSNRKTLNPQAVEAGVKALEKEAAHLLVERTLEQSFDQCYRRFNLGAVRVRTSDYRMHEYSSGGDWSVAAGPVQLTRHQERGTVYQEAQMHFDSEKNTAVFVLNPPPFQGGSNRPDSLDTFHLPPRDSETHTDKPSTIAAENVDRIYISYRGDATWARVHFEIVRGGSLYRSRQTLNLSDRDWVETQLRWPDGIGDPMARRSYLLLEPAGSAPAGSPALAIRLIVRKNTPIGAWTDKFLNHYRTVFRELPFGRYIMNSLALSILNIVLVVFASSLTAYAFARLQWPGRDMCFAIMLATMMIPPQVTMIPSFLIFKHLGWYNTLRPLWVPAAFGAPFFIFLLRQFLKTIPKDLEDAARIDGCGFLRIFWHVMFPLVTPTIAIIAIYTFIGTWNNFMGPLVYVNDERQFPLALGLFKFSLSHGHDVGLLMAGAFVMTLPIVVLFFFVQRYFIQGVTLTGMKG